MSIPSTTLHVTATHLAEDGRGVARSGELEVFVAGLLPGESAEVEIEHKSPQHAKAWAKIVERQGEASPDRVQAACAAFGQCGGCTWQELAYPAQLEQKRRRLQEALDARIAGVPTIPLPHPAPSPLHYRNKGKYVFARKQGAVVLGAYKARTHAVVSTLGCQIVESSIDLVARALRDEAQAQDMAVYDENTDTSDNNAARGLRYAVMRSNAAGAVLLILVCTSDYETEAVEGLALAMQKHPNVVGVLRCDNDSESGVILTDAIVPLCGAAVLEEELLNQPIALGPLAFWQVHRGQAELAYQAIANKLPIQAGSTVLELYAGTGGIALALAEAGHQVIGVDVNMEAVDSANQAATDRGLADRVRFVCEDATRLASDYFSKVSAVVVDPPRKGLGKRGLEQLRQVAVPRIAYLSCGPESLASDLAQLVEMGYRIDTIETFDFMPGTAQVECLALLTRA